MFDSFGLEGFKIFIVDNDQQIINELLYNFKECESKPVQKLKLCTMKFCVEAYQKMSQKTKDQLTDTAQNFFHLLEKSAKLKKSHCMNLLILKNAIQEITTDTCGEFKLYFYKNLFDPDHQSKTLDYQKLGKNTLETRINEIFSTDADENEYRIKKFKEEFNL